MMSVRGCLGEVHGEDAFDQNDGEQDSRPEDREHTRQPRRASGPVDERKEEDDGEQ
jgi:hypothetical protein